MSDTETQKTFRPGDVVVTASVDGNVTEFLIGDDGEMTTRTYRLGFCRLHPWCRLNDGHTGGCDR